MFKIELTQDIINLVKVTSDDPARPELSWIRVLNGVATATDGHIVMSRPIESELDFLMKFKWFQLFDDVCCSLSFEERELHLTLPVGGSPVTTPCEVNLDISSYPDTSKLIPNVDDAVYAIALSKHVLQKLLDTSDSPIQLSFFEKRTSAVAVSSGHAVGALMPKCRIL